MEALKKILGIVWLVLGIALIGFLPIHAVQQVSQGKAEDVVFWTIMVFIFIPISLGFCLFGWYAFKGEYQDSHYE